MSEGLTAEEKQRIEEEERRRVAEEQYREEVRAGLGKSRVSVRRKNWLGILLGITCLVALAAIALLIRDRKMEADRVEAARIAAISHLVPISKPLVSDPFTVAARTERTFPFTISPDMRQAHLVGRFAAEGLSGADIEAVVISEEEFPNWANGHEAKVYYTTNGPKTTDRFDVQLGPGNYRLVFSNRGSLLLKRDVTSEVELQYIGIESK